MTTAIRDYTDALAFLFGRINYERVPAPRSGKKAFNLSRMRDLMERLGNPHLGLCVLHVAGTKGKGSTAAMLASVLTAAGYRTGLYSSPHLYRLEERTTIDGRAPAREQIVHLVRELVPHVAELDRGRGLGPTFFELTTAMAFTYFRLHTVDVAVMEVGMGGRLDSTNVCQPAVSVITSISRDHTRQLGTRLTDIAREKAGIVKPGVPVVSGVLAEPARRTIEDICAERNAPLWQLGRDFHYTYHPTAVSGPDAKRGAQTPDCGTPMAAFPAPLSELRSTIAFASPATFDVETPASRWTALPMPLWGEHQGANGSVAVATLDRLRMQGWELSAAAVADGLQRLRWPARFELLCRRPDVIIDAAHNTASAESVARTLTRSFSAPRRVLVFGTTREKDAAGMLRRLLPLFDDVVLTRYENNPRGVPPEELAELVQQLGGPSPTINLRPADAWNTVRQLAGPWDLICVTGSFFLAAEMRELVLADPFPTAVFQRQSAPPLSLTV